MEKQPNERTEARAMGSGGALAKADKSKRRTLHVRIAGTRRWFKFKYLMLLRAKGGPAKVAKGFSIGLWAEMFTLPTAGLAALLILPVVYLMRASLPGALIGFLFGKIIYIPMSFLNMKVGKWLVPKHFGDYLYFLPDKVEKIVKGAFQLIVGGMVVGAVLGVVAYFPLKWLLEAFTARRKERRKRRKAQLVTNESNT
ncbi:DUF2062 domain-containing protein [Paenibacillus sp. MBLB4367]|uniref:DUF2062 domain-containing protein n=1 Tax=Paenibacillus sp. MBLB4367 TaxID=3384767 RepID=UPI0039082C6B